MTFAGVNYLAIVIAAVAAWLAGAGWYMALGKTWMAALGTTPEKMQTLAKNYLGADKSWRLAVVPELELERWTVPRLAVVRLAKAETRLPPVKGRACPCRAIPCSNGWPIFRAEVATPMRTRMTAKVRAAARSIFRASLGDRTTNSGKQHRLASSRCLRFGQG